MNRQMAATSLPPLGRRLDILILILAKFYLLADFTNGFLLYQLGQSYGFSAAYKSLLLCLMAASCALNIGRQFAWLPLLVVLLLSGPLVSFYQSAEPAGLSADVGMVLKLLAPLLALWYGIGLCRRDPQLARQSLHQLVWFSFLLIVVNLLLGRLGFGLSAYLPSDYFPDQQLGSKGFFKATNELSALLLVFCAYLFSYYWARHKGVFALVVVLALFCSSTLLTKTGNAGVLILALLVPVLQQRERWIQHRRLLLWLAGLAAAGLFSLLLLLPWLLPVLPLSQKLQMVLQQQGLIGLILSNRDLFVAENWFFVERHFPQWQQLIGVGNTGLQLYSSKPLAEIDPADLFIWFGLPGLAVYLLWFGGIIALSRRCWRVQPVGVASGLLLLNLLLLLVSALAGHVVTSGMLWIPWGLLNGCAVLWCQQDVPEPANATK